MKKLLLLFTIFIAGCYSFKKANRQLEKAKDRYPVLVALKTADWFPCKKVEIKTDSSAYKRWKNALDSILSKGEDTVLITDTLEVVSQECVAYKNKIIAITSQLTKAKQTINLIRNKALNPPAIHDTIIKLDSTQIVILSDKLKQSEAEKEKYQKKHGLWFKLGISFLVAFLISLIFNILKRTK